MTITLDARGLRCPLPIIHLAKLATTVADGTVIVVLATDPAAPGDVAAWARMRGHELVTEQVRPSGGDGDQDGDQRVVVAPGAVSDAAGAGGATSTTAVRVRIAA